MKKEDLEIGMIVVGRRVEAGVEVLDIGERYATLRSPAVFGEPVAAQIAALEPGKPAKDHDQYDQPYLPEYERVEVWTNSSGQLGAGAWQLSSWPSRKDFAGFEYEDGTISAQPALIPNRFIGTERPGVTRPLYVLIKTGEA